MRLFFFRRLRLFGLVSAVVAAVGNLCTVSALRADESTAAYFEQLRNRRMFSVAEGYCLQQLGRTDLSPSRRAVFSIELSRTLAEHAQYTAGSEQTELWEQAARSVDDLRKRDPGNPNSSWLEAQRALVAASRGDTLRWQSELFPDEAGLKQRADRALSEAVALLEQAEQLLDEKVRKPPGRPTDDPDVLTPYQQRKLLYEIRYHLGASLLDRARLAPDNAGQRGKLLSRAEEWLKPLVRGSRERETTWNSEVLLADLHLLRGDVKQAESLLTALERRTPHVSVLDRITAVRVKLLLDSNRATDAGQLLSEYRRERVRLPGELRYLKTRMFMDLWQLAHDNGQTDLEAQLLKALQQHVERTEREIGGFWGYRCRVLQQRAEDSSKYGPELAALVRRAEVFFREGKTAESIKAYTQAASLSEKSGKDEFAAEFRFTKASVQLQDRQYQSAAESFRELVERFPQSKKRAEAHLLQAFCLGKLYEQNRSQSRLESYQTALRKHREMFPGNPTAVDAAWMLARLLESRSEFSEALEMYQQIPSDYKHAPEAQSAVARCYESLIEQARQQNRSVEEWEQTAVSRLENIVESYPEVPEGWTHSQAEVGLRLSRIYLGRNIPDYAKSDRLLERIFASYNQIEQKVEDEKEQASGDWNGLLETARQLRIISLAGRNQFGDAQNYLFALTDSNPSEMLAVLDGLTQIASTSQSATQRKLGELQLQAAEFLDRNRGQLSNTEQSRLDHCLAQAYSATNQPGKAIVTYESLLQQNPNDRTLLRTVSLLLSESKTREHLLKAKTCWRKLEAMHEPGSPPWFEARYHVARACFDLKQYDECKKLVGVTRLLYPTLGGEQYREKFTNLRQVVEEK